MIRTLLWGSQIYGYIHKIGHPILQLIIRFYIGNIFWKSGLIKIQNWKTALYLFKNEYKVPILPCEFSCFSTTLIELVCPVLLVAGFCTRLAAIPMIIVSLVIQFTYLKLPEHWYWIILLSSVVVYGPGGLSLDALIKRAVGKGRV